MASGMGVGGTPAVGHLETQRAVGQHLGHSWALGEEGMGEREREMRNEEMCNIFRRPAPAAMILQICSFPHTVIKIF